MHELLRRVRLGADISDLLVADADTGQVAASLRPLCSEDAVVESIAGSRERVDALVSNPEAGVHARVVFAHDAAGRVTWLNVYPRPDRFEGVPGGRIIVVNGPSGAGKSTLLRALQSGAAFPLVVLDEPEQIGTVQPGYLIWRDRAPSLHRGYLAAIGALARAGNHVALSAGGHGYDEILDAFDGVPLVTVGLTCAFDVLLHRERRTGRWAGIAADSLHVHDGWRYDLEFDTTAGPDSAELASRVLALIQP